MPVCACIGEGGVCASVYLGLGKTVTYFGDIVRSQGLPSWPYVLEERKGFNW